MQLDVSGINVISQKKQTLQPNGQYCMFLVTIQSFSLVGRRVCSFKDITFIQKMSIFLENFIGMFVDSLQGVCPFPRKIHVKLPIYISNEIFYGFSICTLQQILYYYYRYINSDLCPCKYYPSAAQNLVFSEKLNTLDGCIFHLG